MSSHRRAATKRKPYVNRVEAGRKSASVSRPIPKNDVVANRNALVQLQSAAESFQCQAGVVLASVDGSNAAQRDRLSRCAGELVGALAAAERCGALSGTTIMQTAAECLQYRSRLPGLASGTTKMELHDAT